MNKKVSLLFGTFLLVLAVCFFAYAMNFSEPPFPWGNKATYLIYGGYLWLLFKFLLDIPALQQRRNVTNGSLLRACIYLFMAVVFFIMELTTETVSIFTIIRGLIVVGGLDVCAENLFYTFMQRNKDAEE